MAPDGLRHAGGALTKQGRLLYLHFLQYRPALEAPAPTLAVGSLVGVPPDRETKQAVALALAFLDRLWPEAPWPQIVARVESVKRAESGTPWYIVELSLASTARRAPSRVTVEVNTTDGSLARVIVQSW